MALAKTKAASGEIGIGLNSNARKEVAEALSHGLANTYLLQLKTQYYHWNVTGPQFISLHLLFEEQYKALAAGVDELAERIRSLGFSAPGTFRNFEELAMLQEDKSLPGGWEMMVANLVAAHESLSRNARERIKFVQKMGDEGTADLFIRRLQEHEKAAWMLRSHLQ
jgi:starvation-inducible DNA-binding protein